MQHWKLAIFNFSLIFLLLLTVRLILPIPEKDKLDNQLTQTQVIVPEIVPNDKNEVPQLDNEKNKESSIITKEEPPAKNQVKVKQDTISSITTQNSSSDSKNSSMSNSTSSSTSTKPVSKVKNSTPKKYIRRFANQQKTNHLEQEDSMNQNEIKAIVMGEQDIMNGAKVTMILPDNTLIHPEVKIQNDSAQLILKYNNNTYHARKFALPTVKKNKWLNKEPILANKQEFVFSLVL